MSVTASELPRSCLQKVDFFMHRQVFHRCASPFSRSKIHVSETTLVPTIDSNGWRSRKRANVSRYNNFLFVEKVLKYMEGNRYLKPVTLCKISRNNSRNLNKKYLFENHIFKKSIWPYLYDCEVFFKTINNHPKTPAVLALLRFF